jgi:hypothetical protein
MRLEFVQRIAWTDILHQRMKALGKPYANYAKASTELIRFFTHEPKEYLIAGKIRALVEEYG